MNKTDLTTGYSLFGGKGDVFSGTAHIYKNGFDPNTLCGKPMLSSNWVQINEVNEVGCPECIRLYKEQTEKLEWFADSQYYGQMKTGVHGSFAQSLSDAWRNASQGNRKSLVDAFPSYFPVDKYKCY